MLKGESKHKQKDSGWSYLLFYVSWWAYGYKSQNTIDMIACFAVSYSHFFVPFYFHVTRKNPTFQLFHERMKETALWYDIMTFPYETIHTMTKMGWAHQKGKKSWLLLRKRIKSANPNHLLSYRWFIMENIIDLCDETLSNAFLLVLLFSF